jgi:hypothetical protein
MAVDPYSLAASGIGTLASLGGGIADAAQAPARKRKFLEEQRRQAQILALRNQKWGGRYADFFPTNALDAKYRQIATDREANENPAFNANPASFLPFVSSATRLAGDIYDYANQPADELKPVPSYKLPSAPEQLTYFDPGEAERDARDPREELHYRDPTGTPWWMR